MSNEVENVLMLNVKRRFDPLSEALWKSCSVITSSYGSHRTCLMIIKGLVPETTERNLDQVCFRSDTKQQATYTLSVRGPFADVKDQLGSFNDRILTNSGNLPRK
jgi:hypothetical protein